MFRQKFTNKQIDKVWVNNILGEHPENNTHINPKSYKFTRKT